MELIHDYQGNPNTTYYVSKQLNAGWLPSDPSWSVHTDDYQYHGTINITTATWLSDNTVFAQLAADLGYPKLDAMAHAMGITSKLTGNPSEVLGGLTYGVTPLQMADAYATIADGGIHHPATIIGRVDFPDGSSDDFGDSKGTRVFSYAESYAADQVLKQVVTHPGATGTEANYNCPVAGKTGTANNLANAWFVGYNPEVSTAVWVGNPLGNTALNNGYGGALAAPIWKDYMQAESDGYCGNWTTPAVPFTGKPFAGPHSATGAPTTGEGETGTTPYTNPYETPTTPAPGATGTPTTPATGTTPAGTGGVGTGGAGTGGVGTGKRGGGGHKANGGGAPVG